MVYDKSFFKDYAKSAVVTSDDQTTTNNTTKEESESVYKEAGTTTPLSAASRSSPISSPVLNPAMRSKPKSPKNSKFVEKPPPDRQRAASWGFGKQYMAEDQTDYETDPGFDTRRTTHHSKYIHL